MGTRTLIVDDCDDDLLEIVDCALKIGKPPRGLHQLIMERKLGHPIPTGMLVDHINGDCFDHQRHNLRLATPQQNRANSRRKRGVSGYIGVTWQACRDRWRGMIMVNGVTRSLGYSKSDPKMLARRYDRAALELHGEFAVTNFPRGDYDG